MSQQLTTNFIYENYSLGEKSTYAFSRYTQYETSGQNANMDYASGWSLSNGI